MMFAVVSMHTEPNKHAKYIEILTSCCAPELIFCMHEFLDVLYNFRMPNPIYKSVCYFLTFWNKMEISTSIPSGASLAW